MRRRRNLDPSSLRDLIPAVVRSFKGRAGGALARVRSVWPDVVGPETARRTRVTGAKEGRVQVEVASAAVKHDLATFRRQRVLEELRRALPDLSIKEVHYRVGAVS